MFEEQIISYKLVSVARFFSRYHVKLLFALAYFLSYIKLLYWKPTSATLLCRIFAANNYDDFWMGLEDRANEGTFVTINGDPMPFDGKYKLRNEMCIKCGYQMNDEVIFC